MRLLKQSTVVRELKSRGWTPFRVDMNRDGDDQHLMIDGSGGARLFAVVKNGSITVNDGRLRGHSNVHVVTYVGPFRSMGEMREELDTSQEVYSQLCGTQFPGR